MTPRSGIYLAFETSTPVGSVAVGNGDRVLAEVVLGAHTKHAEALLPAVDYALRIARVEKAEIARVIVGGGPGSFTGVRISAATAKALAAALSIPLFAYSGLAALAASAGASGRAVCALFDARRSEVYGACYRFPDYAAMQTVLEPAPRTIAETITLVDMNETLFVGDGALENADAIRAAGGSVAPAHMAVPRASALLWLSDVAPNGQVANVSAWEPLYLRESGAERMRVK